MRHLHGDFKLPQQTQRSGARKRAAAADSLSDERRSAAILDTVRSNLDEAKAEDVVVLDLDGKSAIADHMVIASGRSNRHVGSIADKLVETLKSVASRPLRIEGLAQADWVLIDAGDVVVHIFRPDVRSFYNLEKLWSSEAPAERMAV